MDQKSKLIPRLTEKNNFFIIELFGVMAWPNHLLIQGLLPGHCALHSSIEDIYSK